MNYKSVWEMAAIHCNETYGTGIDFKEKFFFCPNCGEPIYKDDWDDIIEDAFDTAEDTYDHCLICGFYWYED